MFSGDLEMVMMVMVDNYLINCNWRFSRRKFTGIISHSHRHNESPMSPLPLLRTSLRRNLPNPLTLLHPRRHQQHQHQHLTTPSTPSPLPPPTYTPLPLLPPTAITPTTLSPTPPSTPCLFPRGHFTPHLPAIRTWFTPPTRTTPIWTLSPTLPTLAQSPPLDTFLVPIEATATTSSPSPSTTFLQSHLPLPLFLSHLSAPPPPSPRSPIQGIYLAQYPLPPTHPLRAFFPPPPPPPIPPRAAADPTLWLGTAASAASPLHCDPRGNVFVQLAGRKRVVLFAPGVGKGVLSALLGGGGNQGARGVGMGEERMGGEGRRVVDAWVWGGGGDLVAGGGPGGERGIEGYEVELGSGDGIFIPKGWWHAVRAVRESDERGTGMEGVCASVCVMFRGGGIGLEY